MSTQPIEHKGYGYTFRQPRRPRADVDFPLGPDTSKNRPEESSTPVTTVRERIRELLATVPRNEDNRFSFRDIADHRDVLEQDWNSRVAGDLKGLGVDVERPFRLTHSPGDNTVTAGNDHDGFATIDRYFTSEADAADDFKTILQLGRLMDTAENRLTPHEMNTRLDGEAMGWWFQSNMDSSALFSGGGIVFGVGGFDYRGIDITV